MNPSKLNDFSQINGTQPQQTQLFYYWEGLFTENLTSAYNGCTSPLPVSYPGYYSFCTSNTHSECRSRRSGPSLPGRAQFHRTKGTRDTDAIVRDLHCCEFLPPTIVQSLVSCKNLKLITLICRSIFFWNGGGYLPVTTLTGPQMNLTSVEWMVSRAAQPTTWSDLADLAAFWMTYFEGASAGLSSGQTINATDGGMVIPMEQNMTRTGCMPSIYEGNPWFTWTDVA
jgi:hypothetical protein